MYHERTGAKPVNGRYQANGNAFTCTGVPAISWDSSIVSLNRRQYADHNYIKYIKNYVSLFKHL